MFPYGDLGRVESETYNMYCTVHTSAFAGIPIKLCQAQAIMAGAGSLLPEAEMVAARAPLVCVCKRDY